MSNNPLTAETDLTAPATKGDLLVLQSRLDDRIRAVDGKVDRLHSRLRGQIADLRVEIGDLRVGIGGQIADLKTENAGMQGQIADLKVSIVRSMVAAVAALTGLMALFQLIAGL